MEQILEPLERAMELTPILGELGYNEKHSFNGLLQVTADGGPSIGESPDVRGLWYGVSVWIKDGPGTGKVIADWMTDGRILNFGSAAGFQGTVGMTPDRKSTRLNSSH